MESAGLIGSSGLVRNLLKPRSKTAPRVRIVHPELLRLGSGGSVRCTRKLTYPQPVDGARLICHIPEAEPKCCARVLVELRKLQLIGGSYCESTTLNTYFVRRGRPGQYKVSVPGKEVDVFIVKYEPEHSGHVGCFAPGHDYFLCGVLGRGFLGFQLPRDFFCEHSGHSEQIAEKSKSGEIVQSLELTETPTILNGVPLSYCELNGARQLHAQCWAKDCRRFSPKHE